MNVHLDMAIDDMDIALLAEIEEGLPLSSHPYAEVGHNLKIPESDVISRLRRMQESGIIRRFGLVLQHRPLGYRANAMVVWDIPDDQVDTIAGKITKHDFVTLCYCRTRSEPDWPYNLYCMIHGRERAVVDGQIALLKETAGIADLDSKTLFSLRRFKQTGARFSCAPKTRGAKS